MGKTKEEQMERRRLKEKARREKIRNNPAEYEQFKKVRRDIYYKKKAQNKIVPIRQLPLSKQKTLREMNKKACKRYREKQKQSKLNKKKSLTEINSIPNTQDVFKSPSTPHFEQIMCDTENWSVQDINEVNHLSSNAISDSQQHAEVRIASVSPVSRLSRPQTRISRRLNYDSDLSSPALSSASSDVSSSGSLFEESHDVNDGLQKNKKPTNKSMRKLRYNVNKEFKLLHKRIAELTQLNNKYRKQVYRLKQNADNIQSTPDSDSSSNNKTEKNKSKSNLLKAHVVEAVRKFYLDDDNSTMCPGKKDCITRNKVKKQKRYLTENIQDLHKKFKESNPHLRISYSHFWKLKPFWVVHPTIKMRDTCLCKQHENMKLIIQALKKSLIINEKTPRDILNSLCCKSTDARCLNRVCNTCHNKNINYNEFDNSKQIYYETWKNVKKQYIKDGLTKTTTQTVKAKISSFPKDVIAEFENNMKPYLKHCSNIVSQSAHIDKLKSNLGDSEVIIHCDFSENYGLKYGQEIQAMHFGSSRQQISLHTVVIYYVLDGEKQTQSFCTLSQCLRHDAVAIWEHLLPILRFIEDKIPTVDILHFISDSPSGQYRNRKMFFVISKLHWHLPSLKFISWNYSEAGHGKGAPDGIGGVLKQSADKFVARGHDLPDLDSLKALLKIKTPGVLTEVIDESGILQKDLLIPTLPKFTGTMQVHQAVWHANEKNLLALRKLSCSLGKCLTTSEKCIHGQHVGCFQLEPEMNRDNIKLPRETKASKKSYVKTSTKKTTKSPSTAASSSKSNDLVTVNTQPSRDLKKLTKKDSPPLFTLKANTEKKQKTTIKSSSQEVPTCVSHFTATSSTLSQDSQVSPKNIMLKLNVDKQFKLAKNSNNPAEKNKKNNERVKILTNKLLTPTVSTPETSKNVSKKPESPASTCIASDDSFWRSVPSIDSVNLNEALMNATINEDHDEEFNIF